MSETLHDIIRRHSGPLEPLATGQEPVLHQLPNIKAVMFDVYGTLLISASGDVGALAAESRGDAFSAALEAMDLDLQCPGSEGGRRFAAIIHNVHEQLHEDGIAFPEVDIVDVWSRVLTGLFQDGLIDHASLDAESLEQLALEYEVRVNPVWPMPGCEWVLRSLHDAGLQMGVISNAQFFTLELFPALFGKSVEQMGFHPELQFYSYRYREAKPGLFLFQLACSILDVQLGIAAEEVLYIGNDMLNDISPAHTAGFRTALFAGDERGLRIRTNDPRGNGATPDLVITDLRQLRECLL